MTSRLRRLPEPEEQREACHRDRWPRRCRPARGRGSSRSGTAGRRSARPRPASAGQICRVPRKPANAHDQPERHDQREERQLPADHGAELKQVESGHRGERDDRACRARRRPPARYWRSATGPRPRAARSRARSASPPVTATGVPKPAAPSKKAPKQKAISSSCSRRSSVMPLMLSLQHLELARRARSAGRGR